MTIARENWNPVAPGFESFWGIVSQSGKVIALRIASEKLARQICDEHNANEQAEIKDNPSILKKYILAPRAMEYFIPLHRELNLTPVEGLPTQIEPRVVAVYRCTGRGPFRDGNAEGWEFEYQGVRIIG